jgi:hypothetical protein
MKHLQPFDTMSFWLFSVHGCKLPASVFSTHEAFASFVVMTRAGFLLGRNTTGERLL